MPTTEPTSTSGIPPNLYRRLREALLQCDALQSNATTRAFFIEGTLAAWLHGVRETDNAQNRATMLIEFLHDQQNDQGESALLLLLRVLSDHTPRGTALRRRLARLVRELGGTHAGEGKTLYLGLRTFDEGDADFFFGRDALIAHLLDKVEGATFLAVPFVSI